MMESLLYRDTIELLKDRYPNNLSFKVDEIAKILSVDKKTVYSYLNRRNNPLRKMPTGNRVIRVSLSSLAHFMSAQWGWNGI